MSVLLTTRVAALGGASLVGSATAGLDASPSAAASAVFSGCAGCGVAPQRDRRRRLIAGGDERAVRPHGDRLDAAGVGADRRDRRRRRRDRRDDRRVGGRRDRRSVREADGAGAGAGAGVSDAAGCGRAERSTGASGGSTSLGGVDVGCAVSRVSSEPLSLAVRMVSSFGGATLVGAVEARISGGAPVWLAPPTLNTTTAAIMTTPAAIRPPTFRPQCRARAGSAGRGAGAAASTGSALRGRRRIEGEGIEILGLERRAQSRLAFPERRSVFPGRRGLRRRLGRLRRRRAAGGAGAAEARAWLARAPARAAARACLRRAAARAARRG